jgi:hypothetical protein
MKEEEFLEQMSASAYQDGLRSFYFISTSRTLLSWEKNIHHREIEFV